LAYAQKEIGMWQRLNTEEGMEGWSLAALTRVHGWQEAEVQLLLAQVRAELKKPGNYTYYNL
jgi:hypothetical protein